MSLETGYVGVWNEDIALMNKTHWSLANCFVHSKLDWDRFKLATKDEHYPDSYKIKTFPKKGTAKYVNFWNADEVKKFFKNYYSTNVQESR